MGGARGTCGSGKMYAVLWLESLKERGHLEDLDLQGEHKFFPSLQTFVIRKLRGIAGYTTVT